MFTIFLLVIVYVIIIYLKKYRFIVTLHYLELASLTFLENALCIMSVKLNGTCC